jgi:2'-5' RNA ligase
MSKRIRTFIAVEIDASIRKQLVALQGELRGVAEGVKWVEAENLHVTLKFLGDVDETQLYAVCKLAQQSVAGHFAFPMHVCGVGAFPNAGRPRIIWAGIQQGADELRRIYQSLDDAFGHEGYPREDRAFTPHLTLGRARQGTSPQQLAGALAKLKEWEAGKTLVREILVMSSQLSSSGPSYSVMGRARLANLEQSGA